MLLIVIISDHSRIQPNHILGFYYDYQCNEKEQKLQYQKLGYLTKDFTCAANVGDNLIIEYCHRHQFCGSLVWRYTILVRGQFFYYFTVILFLSLFPSFEKMVGTNSKTNVTCLSLSMDLFFCNGLQSTQFGLFSIYGLD